MRLVTSSVFAQRYFDPECRPDGRTLRAWVEKGLVLGKIVGQNTYIDLDSWERTSGCALADKIAAAGAETSA